MKTHKLEKVKVNLKLQERGFKVEILEPVGKDGAHFVVRWNNGPAVRIRVSIREVSRAKRHAAFRIQSLPKERTKYFFVFCSVRGDHTWLMSAEEFNREAEGKKFLNFFGKRMDALAGYAAGNFDRLKEVK